MDFSRFGKLLQLQNLRKSIMRKFLASIHTVFLVLTEMLNVPLIMRELPVWCGHTPLHLIRQQSNTWIAYLEELGNYEEQFCRNSDMLNWITSMDGGAHELWRNSSVHFNLKMLRRFVYPSNMKARNTFPTKTSTSLEAGDAASSFEWICKNTGSLLRYGYAQRFC